MKTFLLLPLLFHLHIPIKWIYNNRFNVEFSCMSDTTTYMLGDFTDDYGITYSINDTLWTQGPVIKYHILKWNKKEQYCIARNDVDNPTEAGMYTRIDYMQFIEMKPWTWGFCYTEYKASAEADAENAASADHSNPRKGCNGFPFSRMKPAR
ncbi:MAG: hypothetical protein H7258_00695 [Ferruginibacter sp.]|nr:hypothetical protein [Ferruginibacter sp.]